MRQNLKSFKSPFSADEFNRDYRCSACWEPLVKVKAGEDIFCQCESCGEDTPGYVSLKYVEWRFQIDAAEAAEARCILWNYLPHKKTTETQALQELGF